MGVNALFSNTTGTLNTAMGYEALNYNTTGSSNTGFGNSALESNTTGGNNVALGYNSGDVITTGSNNVVLGTSADPSAASGTNQIVIGKDATGHGDNIAVIGNTDMTAIHPADDNGVDLGSSSYSYKDLYVDGTANIASMNMGVNSTITSSTTFNGTATIIPVNTSSGAFTLTIDSDQLVAGRVLIIKLLSITDNGKHLTIATEGSEQIQMNNNDLSNTVSSNAWYDTIHLFSDGNNWYDLN